MQPHRRDTAQRQQASFHPPPLEGGTARADELGLDYLGWLDAVRALCALYVVFHHIYIGTFTAYKDTSYPGLGWLAYGQLAVVAFIVISGYSLALKPLQRGLVLKEGALGFYRRRCWRILPAYWAALILAMAYHLIIQHDLNGADSIRTFLVHAFLLQDVLHNHSPNGAFWSIAVEMQIYVLFPLVLLLCRKTGVATTVIGLAGVTVVAHLAALRFPSLAPIDHLSPQMFIAFLAGLYAAKLSRSTVTNSNFLQFVTLVTAAAVLLSLTIIPVAIVEDWYFCFDIIFAITVGLIFVQLSRITTHLRGRVFPLEMLGSISYSVYLTHLIVLNPFLKYAHSHDDIAVRFSIMFGLGTPSVLLVGYIFFICFEKPFLTIRSWSSLRRAVVRTRLVVSKPDEGEMVGH